MGCLSVWVPSQAVHAWETDQLTLRGERLGDVTDAANAEVEALLQEAIRTTNRALKCNADAARTQRVLAREIRALTSRDEPVRGRGFFRSLGYGVFAAWLETAPLPRRDFIERTDVFAGIPFGASSVLAMGGTSSTVRLAGVLMGTDKPDHFFETGWRYWRRSREGRFPERGIRYGTLTENTFLGLHTSGGFSFGDLHANWQGYRFYDTLLDPRDGAFALDAQGCVAQVRPFDWHDHVDWRWDEVANPTVYTRKVQRWLDASLMARREELCAGSDRWLDPLQAHLPIALSEHDENVPWIGERAPERRDAFQLAALCGSVDVEPFTPSVVGAPADEADGEVSAP